MEDHVKLQVHHIRFCEYQPQTINCISHDTFTSRLAISRSDASVEILGTEDNWCQEMIFPGSNDASVEALVWAKGRLFAAGLSGNVVELDLATQTVTDAMSSNAGPIWCLTKNAEEDQLAAGTEDGCVVLYDVSEELQFLRGFGKQDGRILSIDWYNREDENVIVTGGINNIRQWSVKSGQPVSRMTLGRQYQKDTIVWCIRVTKDFTIISGDSRGIVTFWNGKESTQLKTFHCHKADVLDLCLSQDEHTAFSGGVDAALFQFSLCSSDPTSGRKIWLKQSLHTRHTHDVRALDCKGGYLASGGVDAILRMTNVSGGKYALDVAPFPAEGVAHIARERNLVKLQYPMYIELWRLGMANKPFAEARGILPLIQKPVKLLQLRARKGQQILCSAIAPLGDLAFSDSKGIRLFRLNLEKEEVSVPQVSVERVNARVAHPARLMTFTFDGQSLVVVLTNGVIQVVAVATGEIRHSIKQCSDALTHRLAASPDSKHFATATLDHGVHVYDVTTGQHVCSCPSQRTQVTALSFSPHAPLLVIAYSNQAIYEFDILQKEFSPWSRSHSASISANWLTPLRHINNIVFPPNKPHFITFRCDNTLCVLDKSQPVKAHSDKDTESRKKRNKVAGVHKCYKYKYLMFVDFFANGMLVVVERPPSMIEEALPPSFKFKKFGTS